MSETVPDSFPEISRKEVERIIWLRQWRNRKGSSKQCRPEKATLWTDEMKVVVQLPNVARAGGSLEAWLKKMPF